MDGYSDRGGAAKKNPASPPIANLIYAVGLLAVAGNVQAASVSGQLRVSARVVSTCRILTHPVLPPTHDGFRSPAVARLQTGALVTSNCSTHPGSVTLMAVMTESSYANEPVVEVIAQDAPGSGGKHSEPIVHGRRHADTKLVRWGIVPVNARLMVSIPNHDRTGGPLPSENDDSIVKLIIDY